MEVIVSLLRVIASINGKADINLEEDLLDLGDNYVFNFFVQNYIISLTKEIVLHLLLV